LVKKRGEPTDISHEGQLNYHVIKSMLRKDVCKMPTFCRTETVGLSVIVNMSAINIKTWKREREFCSM